MYDRLKGECNYLFKVRMGCVRQPGYHYQVFKICMGDVRVQDRLNNCWSQSKLKFVRVCVRALRELNQELMHARQNSVSEPHHQPLLDTLKTKPYLKFSTITKQAKVVQDVC